MKAVWIIGAGVAGLSAALTLARHGQESVLVSSAPSVRAQSVMAEGGINAALDTKGQGDSMEEHFRDTMEAGCDLADPNAVRALTEGAAEVVRTLARLGVAFNRTEGGALDLRYFGGQKKKRTAFAQSSTGRQVMAALIQEARRWEDWGLIRRKDHHEVVKYLTRGQNECAGCIILDKYTKSCEILSGTGLLASGGLNGLFGRGGLCESGNDPVPPHYCGDIRKAGAAFRSGPGRGREALCAARWNSMVLYGRKISGTEKSDAPGRCVPRDGGGLPGMRAGHCLAGFDGSGQGGAE